jgi:spore coat protein U-like protein
MRILKAFGAAVALVGVAGLGQAPLAAQSTGSKQANLKVTAEVIANCAFSVTDLAFGRYDAISANQTTPLDGQTFVTVQCTTGTTATIDIDAGQNAVGTARYMANGPSERLAYELHASATRNSPANLQPFFRLSFATSNTPQTATIYGRIPAGQINAAVGNYEDTVLVTVTF